jgi:phage shock protein A
MDLTREHFDAAIKGLATQLSLDELAERVATVEQTLASHTTSLDAIAKNTAHWRTEAAALHLAYSRHDAWLHQIAGKLGMELSDN